MRKNLPYIVPALVGIYLAVHHAQHIGWGPEVFRFYAKDLILVPILVLATGIVMLLLEKPFHPGNKELTLAVIYTSIMFEVVLPFFGTTFASDPIDVLCYALGALFYKILLKDFSFINMRLATC